MERPGIIAVRHNIEVAHRLSLLEGNKCEAIHGHSMKVKLSIPGAIDAKTGRLKPTDGGDPLEFGKVKKAFRNFLDTEYDHRLLLNEEDPWARIVAMPEGEFYLPGLNAVPGDPSTENIAAWIADWAANEFDTPTLVEVWETDVNMAEASADVGNVGWWEPGT